MAATAPPHIRIRVRIQSVAMGLIGKLAGVVLVGTLAAAALLAFIRVDRTFELWPIARIVGEVFRLNPGQTVTQIVDLPLGVPRGFAIAIQPEFDSASPIEFALRLRQDNSGHDILRESRVVATEGGQQTISTGVWAPIPRDESRRFMLEIGIAPDSGGKAIVFATAQTNVPPNGVAINGAPSAPGVRANVAPLVAVTTIPLVSTLIAESPAVSAVYLLATYAGAALAGWLVVDSYRRAHARPGNSRTLRIVLAGAVPATMLSLTAGTATFEADSLRPFMTEILDGYWRAALAAPWLALIVAVTLRVGVWWWVRAQSSGARTADLWRPRLWWRPAVASSLAVFLLALGPALWRQESAAQTLGAAALLLLVLGLAGGMLAELRRWP